MEATLLCSTGIHLRCGSHSLLVDALNGAIRSFKEIPEVTAAQIIAGQPPYDAVDALVYTHLHPDHYDQAKNAAFLKNHPETTVLFPTEATPDHCKIQAGPFSVEAFFVPHMPCDYTWAKHYALLVEAECFSVYLTADADVDADIHLRNLAGRRVDWAFWNPLFLSYASTRDLMASAAVRSFVYHVPEAPTDETGICRKLARNWSRFGPQLPNVTVLDHYPMELP